MNVLRGLKGTCENSQLRCADLNFYITSEELTEQERRVRTDTLTRRHKLNKSFSCIIGFHAFHAFMHFVNTPVLLYLGGNMLIIFHTYSQISRYHSQFCSVTLKSLHMQLISLAYHQDRKHRKEPPGFV